MYKSYNHRAPCLELQRVGELNILKSFIRCLAISQEQHEIPAETWTILFLYCTAMRSKRKQAVTQGNPTMN